MQAAEPEKLEYRAFRFRWASVAYGCLIFLGVGLFQVSRGAYQSNLTGHPDEAAHFVTGVCVLDYFRTAFGSNPVSFAESYYVRYPKLGLGHWPPGFYVVQALWYGLFGATTVNAILLVGFVTATAALILFLRLRRLYGSWIALFSISILLWLPVTRASAMLVMSDMLASLFTLLAFLAFCDGCIYGEPRYWMRFVLWTVAACGTKESALSLLLFAPLALILFKPQILRRRKNVWRIGLGLCLLISLLLLLYAATGVLSLRGIPLSTSPGRMAGNLPALMSFFVSASIAVFFIGGYGVVNLVRMKLPAESERGILVRGALLWIAVALASQTLLRGEVESRYFLPACFPVVVLFADGLYTIARDIARRSENSTVTTLAAAALTAICLITTPALKLHQRTGYREVAASLPDDSVGPVILVSSDESGEGGAIVEQLITDQARADVVLRASKMLANSDWMGGNYKLIKKSTQEVREFLDTTPVHFIVLDMYGFISDKTRTHHRLLEETIRSEPGQFRLVGDFPLYLDGNRRSHAVQVYENLMARGRRCDVIEVDMGNTLGRTLKVHLEAPAGTVKIPRTATSNVLSSFLERLPRHKSPLPPFSIAPASDSFSANGGPGRIYVTGPAGQSWAANRIPEWISITSGETGVGDGLIAYRVAENTSNEDRLGVIGIGDATFQVSQPRSWYVYVPFAEKFDTSQARKDASMPDQNATVDPPARWILEDQSGGKSTVDIAADGPDGSKSLVLEKPRADKEPWTTRIYLPGIKTEEGATYKVSLWLKAETPSLVWLTFGRKTAPYQSCGLSQAIPAAMAWHEIALTFQATGSGCGAEDNRLSIDAGRVGGRLWVAKVSLVKESSER